MGRRLGIRARVVGAFAAVMLVLLVGAGVAIRSGVDDQITDAIDSQLETRIAAVARLLVERGSPAAGLTEGLDDPGESFTQILDSGGRVVLSTTGLPTVPLLDAKGRDDANEGLTIMLRGVEVEPDEGDEERDTEALEETTPEAFEDDRARVLARSVTVDGRRFDVIVGDTLEDREDALRALSKVLLIALPLSLLAACLVGWLAIGAALRPVDLMRRRAAGISERSFDERLPLPAGDDELRRLGETLNAMLDRLSAALERERGFVADASHEMRTPLAILRTELELALRAGRSSEELRDAIGSALEEAEGLASLTESLLTLAQADDDGLTLARAPVDAAALVRRVASRYEDGAVDLDLDARSGNDGAGDPDLMLEADAGRLEQALVNLVDNAIRHGGAGTSAAPVVISIDRPRDEAGAVVFVIGDRGPGIPEDFLGRAFDRFARADASRTTAGTGLGLAIVRAIARAHGGEVALAAREGGGTEARLTLPRRA
jgi:heavy metal sensor kinase